MTRTDLLRKGAMAAALTIILAACGPAIVNYAYLSRQRYPPRPDAHFIDVYRGKGPEAAHIDKPYEVLAEFQVKRRAAANNLIEKARSRARRAGGDAIVMTDPEVQGVGNGLFDLDQITVWILRYK